MAQQDELRALNLTAEDRDLVELFLNENKCGVADLVGIDSIDELEIDGISDAGKTTLWQDILKMKNTEKEAHTESQANLTNEKSESLQQSTSDQTSQPLQTSQPEPSPTAPTTSATTTGPASDVQFEGDVIGLQNLGNTCFMNSAIQCLLHTPGFTHSLVDEALALATQNEENRSQQAKNLNSASRKSGKNGKSGKNANTNIRVPAGWKQKLKKGDDIDAMDTVNDWCAATVLSVGKMPNSSKSRKRGAHGVHIHFKNWSQKYDAWYPINSNKISYRGTHCDHWMANLGPNDEVDYCVDAETDEWIEAVVTRQQGYNVYLQCNVYNSEFEQKVGRAQHKKLAARGTHTASSGDNGGYSGTRTHRDSWSSTFFGLFASSADGSDASSRAQKPTRAAKRQNSFYNAWIDLIMDSYGSKMSASPATNSYYGQSRYSHHSHRIVAPNKIHRLMSQSDPSLGDGGQHDSNEALMVILNGIEESLPESRIYSTPEGQVWCQMMPRSYYSSEYSWNLEKDVKYYNKHLKGSMMDEDANLVTKYFDGVDVQVDTCLECGFQRRFYSQFREMQVPVVTKFAQCNVIYQTPDGSYAYQSIKLTNNASTAILKYVTLWNLLGGKTANIYQKQWNHFALVRLNNLYQPRASPSKANDSNLNKLASLGSVVSIKGSVSDLISNLRNCSRGSSALMLVRKYVLPVTLRATENVSSCHVLHLQLFESAQSAQSEASDDANVPGVCNINVSVLNVSFGANQGNLHKTFEKALVNSQIGFFNGMSDDVRGSIEITSLVNGAMCSSGQDVCRLKEKNNIIISILKVARKADAAPNKNNDGIESFEDEKKGSELLSDDVELEPELKTTINMFRILWPNGSLEDQLDFIKNRLSNVKFDKQENEYYMQRESDTYNGLNDSFGCIDNKSFRMVVKAGKLLSQELKRKRMEMKQSVDKVFESINMLWKRNDCFKKCSQRNDLKQLNLKNVEECLEAMQEVQFLSGDNIMRALECKCSNNSAMFVRSERKIVVGPKLLIIVLNRGKAESSAIGSGYGRKGSIGSTGSTGSTGRRYSTSASRSYEHYSSSKYNHTIEFGDELNAFEVGNEYELRAVCNHSGYSAKGGHYTANVKHLGTDEWYHCNDQSVSQCGNYRYYDSSRRPFDCKDAIMMIYSKK